VSHSVPSADESSDSSDVTLTLNIARAMEQRDDLRGAEEAYRHAFELLDPTTSGRSVGEAALGLGRTAERMGDMEEARRAYQKAIDVANAPTAAGAAWLGLAGVAERMGDPDEARRAYQKIIETGGPEQASMVWLAMERLRKLLEQMGYAAEGPSKQPTQAAQLRIRLHASDSEMGRLRKETTRIRNEAAHLYRIVEEEAPSPRRSWNALWFARREPGLLKKLETASDDMLRNVPPFVFVLGSGWVSDQLALHDDQVMLSEHLRDAVLKLLLNEHPHVFIFVFTELLARKTRSDIQYQAKLGGTPELDDEALLRLKVDLTNLRLRVDLKSLHEFPLDKSISGDE